MVFTKCKTTLTISALALMASGYSIGLLAASSGPSAIDATTQRSGQQNTLRQPMAPLKPIEAGQVRTDAYGDPLPPQALARLGTLKKRAADSHLAISADGKEIITVGSAMTVRVWDAATGEMRFAKQLLDKGGPKIFLSPRGKFLLVESFQSKLGRRLALWDLAAEKVARALSLARTAWIEAIAFSADETQAAIAETTERLDRHRIHLWDLASGKARVLHEYTKEFNAHVFEPALQFSPDGKRLIAVQRDNTMRTWDLTTDQLVWEAPTPRPFFCISADSKWIAREAALMLDAHTGDTKEWTVRPPENVMPLAFSPDGRHLAFLTLREGVLIWEIESGKTVLDVPKLDRRHSLLTVPNQPPTDFAFAPDGSAIIWGLNPMQRWNLADGKTAFPETKSSGHTGAVWKLVFSPDGKRLASTGKDDRVLLWDVAERQPLFPVPGGFDRMLAFPPGGKRLLTKFVGEKSGIGSWDVASGRLTKIFEWNGPLESLIASSNKELCVTASGDKILMLTHKHNRRDDECYLTVWDAASGKRERDERVPWGEESVLTPDGQSVLVFASRQGDIELRALDTGAPRWRLPNEGTNDAGFGARGELVVSADGTLLAASGWFNTNRVGGSVLDGIRVADMATGRQLMKLDIDKPARFSISTDNRLLAVAMADGVQFWEIASHQQVGFLPAPNRKAQSFAEPCAQRPCLFPDSCTLATGHTDSTILLWDATLQTGAAALPLAAADLGELWNDLMAADAIRAQAAGWRFVGDPKATVAFLKDKLASVMAVADDVMRQLLRDLDSPQFKQREAAEKELRSLGDLAEPGLRQALKSNLSLEATRRIVKLLEFIDQPRPYLGERLRTARALQVVARIDTPESRLLLSQLSQGNRPTWLKRAAAGALQRMKAASTDEE